MADAFIHADLLLKALKIRILDCGYLESLTKFLILTIFNSTDTRYAS